MALQTEDMGKRFVDPDAIVSYMNLLSVNFSVMYYPDNSICNMLFIIIQLEKSHKQIFII